MGFFLTLNLVGLLALTAYLIHWRIVFTLNPKRNKPIRHGRRNPKEPTHLLIVLGSGGHTAEMLSMLDRSVNESDPSKRMDLRDFSHRTWVVSSGDSLSAERAHEFEEMASNLTSQETLMAGKVKRATDIGPGKYEIVTVPRAREIHQSLYSSPMSSLQCFSACWKVLRSQLDQGRDFPDLIMVNGPATGTIMVAAATAMRLLNYKSCVTRNKMRTIYVESFARVKKLSLSGKLLSRVVDRFLVQWPQLDARRNGSGRAQYVGVLV
jgi:beta-1,4-N-acetylglucosaminyltransferase